jgi:hypothetical protein
MMDTVRIPCAGDTDEYVKVTSDHYDYLYIKTVIDYDTDCAAELNLDGVNELIETLQEWKRLGAAVKANMGVNV